MTDQDSVWKEVLEQELPDVLALLFPEVHADLDWARDTEALEQEMRKLHPQAATGKRIVDRLVKAYQKGTGDERYLHLEVQGQPEDDFPRRLHVYNYKAEDHFGQPVA